jgi:hypothetical protein
VNGLAHQSLVPQVPDPFPAPNFKKEMVHIVSPLQIAQTAISGYHPRQ